ncbi:MAG: class I SAM-dependent methyltransferase [Planctomycetes bacterium]|nr:class I SAM-dependent methyltransferase [Planctomycetota bacterium]MCB9869853.1 class I SAM-dependent methyltransferase [Planctomycetota bacterium]
MALRQLRRTWEALGRDDPLWAILTHEGKRGGRWQLDPFFRTGREEVDAVLATAASHAPELRRARALDFGCGVGRLTQALARHFAAVDGVDIAASMVAQASELDRGPHGSGGRCTFHAHTRADLSLFGDAVFDFVYSSLTLQHMPPRLALAYLDELCRVLRPGGLLVFDLPERPKRSRSHLGRWASRVLRTASLVWHRHLLGRARMDMFGIAPARIAARVARAGCRVVWQEPIGSGGPDWWAHRYGVARIE